MKVKVSNGFGGKFKTYKGRYIKPAGRKDAIVENEQSCKKCCLDYWD